jgi:hypothetical protein
VETGPPRRAAWSLVALLGGTGATLLAILGHAARAGADQEGLLVPAAEALVVGLVELGRGIALVAGSGLRAVRWPLLFVLLAWLAVSAWRGRASGSTSRLFAAVGLAGIAQSLVFDGLLAWGVALYAIAGSAWLWRRGAPVPYAGLPARIAVPVLAALVGLAALLCVHELDVRPRLHIDELAYHTAARMRLGQLEPGTVMRMGSAEIYGYERFRAQAIPHLAQSLGIGWLGPGILSARIVSVALALGALLVAALALRRQPGMQVALLMVALAAADPLALSYARRAHYIAATVFHGALAFAALVWLERSMRPRAALLLGLLLGASLYAYQLSWFVPVLCGLCVLSRPALLRPPRSVVLAGIALVAALAVALPGLFLLRDGVGQVLAQTGDKAFWRASGREGAERRVAVTVVAPRDEERARASLEASRVEGMIAGPLFVDGDLRAAHLMGSRDAVRAGVASLEGADWRAADHPDLPSPVDRTLSMLDRLFWAPGLELIGAWTDVPILNPLLAPLLVLGWLESWRRRADPVLRVLCVWVLAAALLPAAFAGAAPRRAVLMLPFAQALAALPLLELARAPRGRAARGLAAGLCAIAVIAIVAVGAHLSTDAWARPVRAGESDVSVKSGARPGAPPEGARAHRPPILELEKLIRSLSQDETVIVPSLYARLDVAKYLERIGGPAPPVVVARNTATPQRVLQTSCRTVPPFRWVTPDTPAWRSRFAHLRERFAVAEERRGDLLVVRVERAKPGACEGRGPGGRGSARRP